MTKNASLIFLLCILNIHFAIGASEKSALNSTATTDSTQSKIQLAQNDVKESPGIASNKSLPETATSEARIIGRTELQPDAWANLKTLQGIEIKNKPSDSIQMIIFFDANCPHCAELWQRLYGKDTKQNQIASLWIPVAYMKKESEGRAAYLLEHANRPALAVNFEDFDHKTRSGAAPISKVTPLSNKVIKRNMAFWNKLFPATPLMVFRTKGNKTFSHTGLPPQEQFEQLLQQIPPPSLEGFQK